MATLKCKMCGGDLVPTGDGRLSVCDYCGTVQTVPTGEDDRKLNLFNRANKQRLANDFDKATETYEKLVTEFPDDAESYWGLCLSKYGIEYVDDPKTGCKVPTCHRASFEAITADPDYKAALDHADAAAREVYLRQGAEIDVLQRGILEIVRNEKPFDVFLCYKETDEAGRRTPDSVIANDIYYQLTNEGFKVFYAAITLESKLGQEYEPYIFAALHSAKVMLVVGTKPEYFNAVWVKNEWNRFLKLMKTDRQKLLIPCYRDMDAYDLPEEFSHLQAQDMSKIGFISDVTRGIKKVLQKDAPTPAPAAAPTAAAPAAPTANVANLLKRVSLFLENGDFKSADEYCERVLDQEPENAEAYVGKLLAELNVRSRAALKNQPQPFDRSLNYQSALRFGNDALKDELTGAVRYINDRNETARKDGIYDQAQALLNNAKSEQDFEEALKIFRQIPGHRDADQKVEACVFGRKDFIYNQAQSILNNARAEQSFETAKKLFGQIPGHRNADEMVEKAETGRKEFVYQLAEKYRKDSSVVSLDEAVSAYGRISGYRDADERAREAAEALQKEKRKSAKKKKITLLVILAAVVLLVGFLILNKTVLEPNRAYNAAVALMDEGKYDEAIAAFEALNGYQDSKDQIEAIRLHWYEAATTLMNEGKYAEAGMNFGKAGNLKDAAEQSRFCWEKAGLWKTVAAGSLHTVGLKSDGTVVAVGDNEHGQCDVSGWRDIVSVSSSWYHTVGLKADGTVVAVGDNEDGQCDVSGWTDIVAIAAGSCFTAGLKADGTVVATRYLGDKDWKNVVSIAAGSASLVGLRADGTVVSTDSSLDVSGWTDIVAVAAGLDHIVGLKADGTVVAVGDNEYGQCSVSGWKNIVAIEACWKQTFGLKADGTVVAVGDNEEGQCNVSGWKNIVAVAAGVDHTVGLKADGSVVAVGDNWKSQRNVSGWKSIRVPEK